VEWGDGDWAAEYEVELQVGGPVNLFYLQIYWADKQARLHVCMFFRAEFRFGICFEPFWKCGMVLIKLLVRGAPARGASLYTSPAA